MCQGLGPSRQSVIRGCQMSESMHVSATFLRPLQHLLKAGGHDEVGFLAGFGLTPADVANADLRLPADTTAAMLDGAQRLLADPTLGISLSRHTEYAAFGGLGLALAAGGSLRGVLMRITRYHRLISDVTGSRLEHGEKSLDLYFYANTSHVPHPHAILFVMASIVRMLRFRLRRDLNPVAVTIPPLGDVLDAAIRRYFRCDIRHGDEFALHFDPSAGTDELDASDTDLASVLDSALDQRLRDNENVSLAARLALWLEERLPEGEPQLSEAASRCHMSVRSLQRRLGEEKLTWQKLLENTRRALVERHLGAPGMSVTEMAFLLGFSEVSSFSRAFKKWYGVAPSRFPRRGM